MLLGHSGRLEEKKNTRVSVRVEKAKVQKAIVQCLARGIHRIVIHYYHYYFGE